MAKKTKKKALPKEKFIHAEIADLRYAPHVIIKADPNRRVKEDPYQTNLTKNEQDKITRIFAKYLRERFEDWNKETRDMYLDCISFEILELDEVWTT